MTLDVPPMSDTIDEIVRQLRDDNSATAVGERHPVIRSGERGELSRALRWLIWHRDRGRCQMCGVGNQVMHLDHILPWSAGGPDVSSNLRVLCGPCNEDRSNYRSFELGNPLPVTRICDPCIDRHHVLPPWHRDYPHCPICHGERLHDSGRPYAEEHVAFCGSCKRRSTVSDTRRLM